MSKILLPVPVISQIPKSQDCGVACLMMVLEYYFPQKFQYEQIKEQMNFIPSGLSSFSLAIFLLQNGMNVKMVYMNPFLFNLDHQNQKFELADLLDYISKMSTKKIPVDWTNTFPELIKFLELGGELVIDYPKRSHIQEALANGNPIIAVLTTWFLAKQTFEGEKDRVRGFFNSHFNVITGLDGDRIFVNDPEFFEPDFQKSKINGGYELGGPQNYNVDDYLFGIYTNIGQDLDNGAIIIASPK